MLKFSLKKPVTYLNNDRVFILQCPVNYLELEPQLHAIRERLEKRLTPDGFLASCCQINRGGEELQKRGYRVISQYVMGLMAHLYV